MATTWGAGVTAAAGTGLTPPLFQDLFRVKKSVGLTLRTWSSLVTIARIAKFSRLLHPVGSGFVSQNPSPGDCSHNPYTSKASGSITPTTT